MSRQLAVSAAFSVLMMASYVLFGADAARAPASGGIGDVASVQLTAPSLAGLAKAIAR